MQFGGGAISGAEFAPFPSPLPPASGGGWAVPLGDGPFRRLALLWNCSVLPLEKEMATPTSILAWKIPWTEDPGRLQSMGSQRVGHD